MLYYDHLTGCSSLYVFCLRNISQTPEKHLAPQFKDSFLFDHFQANSKFERTKEASLEAIGYICADVQPELLAGQSNQILNAICVGLQDSEQSPHVRLAAITAMLNSLEFTKANFDRDTERHHIMQVC